MSSPSGSFAATPRVLGLSGGSGGGGSGGSIGDTPVSKTDLPRDSGPHQGGVSVPPDTVPQVSTVKEHSGTFTFVFRSCNRNFTGTFSALNQFLQQA